MHNQNEISSEIEFLYNNIKDIQVIIDSSLKTLTTSKYKDFRMFIAERVLEMSSLVDNSLEGIYKQSDDDDVLYWVAHILLERKNYIGVKRLLDVVKNNGNLSESAFTALKLSKMGVKEVYPLIIEKLRMCSLDQTYHIISFFDALKNLELEIPKDIVTKLSQSNAPWQIKETIKGRI